ncbi:MAG: flagellar hook-associated protein FlgL [Deltaproteobacteria bacterium]|nr:flagellar hook-associated protein FlgL [Deltaproteobacteria bacterium]
MKATQGTTYRNLQAELNRQTLKLNNLRNMVSTGKRITRASDDPSAISPVLEARKQIRLNDTYLNTLGMAQDKLKVQDTYLEQGVNVLVRAKEVAVNAVNATLDSQSLSTLADQIVSLRTELVDAGNAQVEGKFIFAGYNETVRPFAVNAGYDPALYDPANSATWPIQYQGDENPFRLEISPGEVLEVGLPGCDVFMGDADNDGSVDAGCRNVFGVLSQLEEAIRANDPAAVNGLLEDLDQSLSQISRRQGALGVNAQRVESAMDHMAEIKLNYQETLSRYEDADLVASIALMNQQETAFEAALKVTSRVSQLSILDFL